MVCVCEHSPALRLLAPQSVPSPTLPHMPRPSSPAPPPTCHSDPPHPTPIAPCTLRSAGCDHIKVKNVEDYRFLWPQARPLSPCPTVMLSYPPPPPPPPAPPASARGLRNPPGVMRSEDRVMDGPWGRWPAGRGLIPESATRKTASSLGLFIYSPACLCLNLRCSSDPLEEVFCCHI